MLNSPSTLPSSPEIYQEVRRLKIGLLALAAALFAVVIWQLAVGGGGGGGGGGGDVDWEDDLLPEEEAAAGPPPCREVRISNFTNGTLCRNGSKLCRCSEAIVAGLKSPSVQGTEGSWGAWRSWTPCTARCGGGGTRMRMRNCVGGGGFCGGDATQEESGCATGPCGMK